MHTLQHDGSRFWTGATPDGRQVLLGPSLPNIVLYFFDADGNFILKELVSLQLQLMREPASGVYLTGPAVMEAIEQEVQKLVEDRDISLGTIRIRPFFDDEEGAGVKELPSEFEEFLEHPERFAEPDSDSIQASLAEWRDEERFVLVWGEELWVAADGELLAT